MGLWSSVKRLFGRPPTAPVEPIFDLPIPPEATAGEIAVPDAPAPTVVSIAPIARDLALEAAIAEDRDAIGPYLVYADWLQERGDPRGELISIQIAMVDPSDGESLRSMRERERELLTERGDYLRGPLPLLSAGSTFRRGFIDTVHIYNDDGLRDVLAALAIDHPATRFVTEIWLPDRLANDAERTREQLAAIDRDCRVATGYADDEPSPPLRFLEGDVLVKPESHEIAISASIREPPGTTSYTYLVRTTVTTDAGTRRWWYGSSSDVTEESIGDEPPFTGIGHVDSFHTARLDVVLRVDRTREDDTQDVLWFAGGVELREGVEKLPMLVRPCAAVEGEMFDPPREIEETPGPRGPVLVVEDNPYPEHVNSYGAALPDVGVFDGARQLVTATAPIALPDLAAPGDSYVDAAIGGPAGALAIMQHVRRDSDMVVSLMRVPNAPIHKRIEAPSHCGLWSPDGTMFALATYFHQGVVVLGDRGEELAAVQVEVPDDDERETLPSLTWHEGALFVAYGGACSRCDVAAGATTSTAIPHALGYAWRQYGAGAPSYHPQSGRIAWMMCVEFPSDRAPQGVTLISWRDRDGAYDTIAVSDHGWADKARFGNVTVLADGRILAIGTRVWVVDPTDRAIRNLGIAGNYTAPPAITIHDGTLRLWSHGSGPWWIEL